MKGLGSRDYSLQPTPYNLIMCGIFGYIGHRSNASQIIFEGLRTLEYRGYDSWGIALQVKSSKLKVKSEIVIEKQVGKLPEKIRNSQF